MRSTVILAALAVSVPLTAMPQPADAQRHVRREVRREIRQEIREENREDKRRNTLIGAGVGLLGGALLSGGDPWATVAGAAAGGVVGNVTTKKNYRLRDLD